MNELRIGLIYLLGHVALYLLACAGIACLYFAGWWVL